MSALLYAAIMLTGLLWSHWSFLLLFTIIHIGCWWEYQQLMGRVDESYRQINPFHRYGIIVAGWGLMLVFAGYWKLGAELTLDGVGMILLLVGLVAVFLCEVLLSRQLLVRHLVISVLGLLYISLSWGLLLNIRSGAMWMPHNGTDTFANLSSLLARINGYVVPVILIGSIWINDTMAYIVGSLLGKTPLSPVSPKKTWEGTIGGVVLAVAIMWGLGALSHSSASWIWASVGAIAAVAGTVGDLLESKLKRMAGVKDSGAVLPGHGGFLDRFDSMLLAVPFVWVYLKLVTLF
ncbi:MAG TPA: phosphatidate cytidylyltransferase [Lacibacter sp.]|nr:phosphatidate cytidylyltransferase [Lacibacter sp.]HMO88600.1 phosphatidate cytidylyltransferase [Lacibacter sp.]HMP85970.1 phosphatidate cytidylyltransferase [Lacibacter sp.]